MLSLWEQFIPKYLALSSDKLCEYIKTVSQDINKIRQDASGLAHATGVHERNTVPYARFALKKRHGFCAKAREKNMQRHRLGTL